MSDDQRRLTTEEQRTLLHAARNRGGLCAACGRTLSTDEPVYIERVMIREVVGSEITLQAPLGVECASAKILD